MAAAKKKPLTPAQREKARKADAKRYAKDKKKRIAAETAYKEKMKGDPTFDKKIKARAKVNNAVRDGRMEKPAGKKDFHHTKYKGVPEGLWEDQGSHRKRPNKAKGSPAKRRTKRGR